MSTVRRSLVYESFQRSAELKAWLAWVPESRRTGIGDSEYRYYFEEYSFKENERNGVVAMVGRWA